MIKVNAIEENGTLIPESVPNTKFGSHCDGEFFYFFESEEEKLNFEFYLKNEN